MAFDVIKIPVSMNIGKEMTLQLVPRRYIAPEEFETDATTIATFFMQCLMEETIIELVRLLSPTTS